MISFDGRIYRHTNGNFINGVNSPYLKNFTISSWIISAVKLAAPNLLLHVVDKNLNVITSDVVITVQASNSKSFEVKTPYQFVGYVDPEIYQWPLKISIQSSIYAADYSRFLNNYYVTAKIKEGER